MTTLRILAAIIMFSWIFYMVITGVIEKVRNHEKLLDDDDKWPM